MHVVRDSNEVEALDGQKKLSPSNSISLTSSASLLNFCHHRVKRDGQYQCGCFDFGLSNLVRGVNVR